jgi:hypothetical protein
MRDERRWDIPILLAEDHAETAEIYAHMLRGTDYTLHWCATGRACLEAANAYHFAGAILDLRLPDIDGDILMRELRQRPKTSALPIILASASNAHLQALTAADLELVQAVLIKPFGFDEFLSTVARVIGPPPG